MTRLTMLFIAVALVLPGAAFGAVLDENGIDQAAAQRKAEAVQRYYASYREPKALPAPVETATGGHGLSWTLAIGGGVALVLVAGGLGVYAGRVIRPRHLGA